MPLPALLATSATNIGNAGTAIAGAKGIFDTVKGLFKKPDGIPAPMTGAEAGLFQKDFMDTAFSGTTPWERLGSSQSGAPQQATLMGAKMQDRIADKTLQNQKQIADQTNRAHVIGSMAQFGKQGIDFGLGKLSTSIGAKDGFDTAISMQKQKLPLEIQNLEADKQKKINEATESFQRSLKTASEADLVRAQARYADELAKAGLSKMQSEKVLNWAKSLGETAGSVGKLFSGGAYSAMDGMLKRVPRFFFRKGR